MWQFIKTYPAKLWPYYIFGLIALLITNYVTTLIPLSIRSIIDALSLSVISNDIISHNIWILVGLAVLLGISRTLSRILIFQPGRIIEYRLRNDVYAHLISVSKSFFRHHEMGDILSRVINDIQSLRLLSALGFLHVLNTIIIYGMIIFQMSRIHVPLMIMTLLPIPIVIILSLFIYHPYPIINAIIILLIISINENKNES